MQLKIYINEDKLPYEYDDLASFNESEEEEKEDPSQDK